jgi:threonine synthase
MDFVTDLTCVKCKATYAPAQVQYTCPACGDEGVLDVRYDYARIRNRLDREALERRPDRRLWRYRELLPIPPDAELPKLFVGDTPIYPVPRLASALGLQDLWLKDDGRNPTHSFKDRASSVGAVRAKAQGAKTIACASTGNAASSLAGMTAALGLRSVIFVPERAPEPKLAQLLIFGAHVVRVRGRYEDAYELCMQACRRWGWYNRNCAINPYLVEGKKTAGLEIAEQTGWNPPDWVALSVGDGCTLAGAWKGVREMHALGFTSKAPRMLGVQAAGAAPVYRAWRDGKDLVPTDADTLADSIAVGHPRNWRKAIAAVRESGGVFVTVADEEILEAMRLTARLGGTFGEPAAAAAVAGVGAAVRQGLIPRDARTLAVITGSGLKDVRSALQAVGAPLDVTPEMGSLEAALGRAGVV